MTAKKKRVWYKKFIDAGQCVRCHSKQSKSRMGMFLCSECSRAQADLRRTTKGQTQCSNCKQLGHNISTCTEVRKKK